MPLDSQFAALTGIHHLHMEEPAAVAAIVREFLQALPG